MRTVLHPTPWDWAQRSPALNRLLEAIRGRIRRHPIKFVVLGAWSAFFFGLVIRG